MYNFLLRNQSGFSPGFPWLFDFLVSVCPGFEFVVVDPVVGRSQSGVAHVLFAQQVVVDSLLDFSGALQSTYKICIACQWLSFDNLTFKLQNVDRNQLSYVVTKTIEMEVWQMLFSEKWRSFLEFYSHFSVKGFVGTCCASPMTRKAPQTSHTSMAFWWSPYWSPMVGGPPFTKWNYF